MGRIGAADWEVVAVAPSLFRGDLRTIQLEKFPDEACRVEAVEAHLTRFIHFMYYDKRLGEVLREKWDVVHCWEEPYIVAGNQIARLTLKDAKLVYATFQNVKKRYPPPFNLLEREAMKRADAWIAFGHTVEQNLIKQTRYNNRPHRVIALGVDTKFFKPDAAGRSQIRRRLGWDDVAVGAPVVGYLGRFVPEKGLKQLMDALDEVKTKWRALFVGGGAMEKELRRWSDHYGEQVKIVAGVTHDEVPHYLNAMDVLCAPSQTTPQWREQLGRMLIEAFACGVPVVASDSGEIPFVVEDAGIIVAEADTKAWARELTAILEDAPRRAELSKRGLERAHTVYAWEKIACQHLSFFDELLQSK